MLDRIRTHLNELDLDIRQSGIARYFDQKTKTDVVDFIARCILELTKDDRDRVFTNRDIWGMDYFKNEAHDYFNKPKPSDPKAASEYNKFISQPVLLLTYSKLLNGEKICNRWEYTCQNRPLLEYVSQRPQHAGVFLAEYYEKIFRDSGLGQALDDFLKRQTTDALDCLKDDFYELLYNNTPVGKRDAKGNHPGRTEARRIFNPALNVICAKHRKKGTERGRIANHVIRTDELFYNRVNFQDLWKMKEVPRSEAEITTPNIRLAYYHKRVISAKNLIKRLYGRRPMFLDGNHQSPVMEIHHIILRSQKPEFGGYLENLINLSPTQHKGYAHSQNGMIRTTSAAPKYQRRLLIANSHYIEKSINKGQPYYSKPQLIDLINYGMNLNTDESHAFDEIRQVIGKGHLNQDEIAQIANMVVQ